MDDAAADRSLQASCLFLPDGRDGLVVQHAAGDGASDMRRLRRRVGTGVAGWVAAPRRAALNADPTLDFGEGLSRAGLTASLTVPLLHEGTLEVSWESTRQRRFPRTMSGCWRFSFRAWHSLWHRCLPIASTPR